MTADVIGSTNGQWNMAGGQPGGEEPLLSNLDLDANYRPKKPAPVQTPDEAAAQLPKLPTSAELRAEFERHAAQEAVRAEQNAIDREAAAIYQERRSGDETSAEDRALQAACRAEVVTKRAEE